MNIYLLNEDGPVFCIRAKTMQKAVSVAEGIYLQERKTEEGDEYNESDEREYYHESVLQSCALVAELKN